MEERLTQGDLELEGETVKRGEGGERMIACGSVSACMNVISHSRARTRTQHVRRSFGRARVKEKARRLVGVSVDVREKNRSSAGLGSHAGIDRASQARSITSLVPSA